MKNYYQILGVSRHSDIQEIKRSYRKLATKFHPDKNNGDAFFEEMFKEILEAYEILSDNLKKTKYDIQYDNTFISKERNINNEHSYTAAKEKPNDNNGVNTKKQHSNYQHNTQKKKKSVFKNFFVGMIIVSILKFAFWIKKETHENKDVTHKIVNSQKKTENKTSEFKINLKIDGNKNLKEGDYIYFRNDNFKIISDYKFQFSEEASNAANKLSVFPTNTYIYDYFDDDTNPIVSEFTQFSIQVMDIQSIYNSSQKSKHEEITKKYFNSVKLNISIIDKNYKKVKKGDVISLEYYYAGGTADTQIPTISTFFVKNKKSYIISVSSRTKLIEKNHKFKDAFKLI